MENTPKKKPWTSPTVTKFGTVAEITEEKHIPWKPPGFMDAVNNDWLALHS